MSASNITVDPRTESNLIKLLIAAGTNVPSIFPKCTVGETDVVANKVLLGVPIITIIYETSERSLELRVLILECDSLKFHQVLFGVVYWAKVKKYREDENWLIRKIYWDAFMYYLFLVGEFLGTSREWLSYTIVSCCCYKSYFVVFCEWGIP
jgi:hypothetical protein